MIYVVDFIYGGSKNILAGNMIYVAQFQTDKIIAVDEIIEIAVESIGNGNIPPEFGRHRLSMINDLLQEFNAIRVREYDRIDQLALVDNRYKFDEYRTRIEELLGIVALKLQ